MLVQQQVCNTCEQEKPLTDFYRLQIGKNGRNPKCIICYKAHKAENIDQIRSNRRVWERQVREEVLAHYGGKCMCPGCTEAQYEFLAIDHIHGGGRKHRESIKTPLPYWLKKNGFPEGFRVLCHNCNMSR